VVIHHLIMEHGEVQRKAQFDWVARRQLNFVGFCVSFERVLFDFFELCIFDVLGNVAVVISDHFNEKGASFSLAILGKHLLIDGANDSFAVGRQLRDDVRFVGGERGGILLVLRVLLDGSDGATRRSLRRYQVFEGD